ncbi:MAG: hypothetical protein M3Q80_01975 [bacterium]|nr:hypothetical protein [bacterium]
MKTISDYLHNFHERLDSMHLSKLEHITLRVIAVTTVINLGIIALAFRMHFHQIPLVEATAQGVVEIGTATTGFIHELGVTDLQLAKNITRKKFSAPGTLLTLENDNIQVFEYTDGEIASADLEKLVEYYYSDKAADLDWKDSVHIYRKDNLVIFYMGANKEILTVLNSFAGLSSIRNLATSN